MTRDTPAGGFPLETAPILPVRVSRGSKRRGGWDIRILATSGRWKLVTNARAVVLSDVALVVNTNARARALATVKERRPHAWAQGELVGWSGEPPGYPPGATALQVVALRMTHDRGIGSHPGGFWHPIGYSPILDTSFQVLTGPPPRTRVPITRVDAALFNERGVIGQNPR